jgi:photosystem II stability/assembly factor-like uncharacterized protein
MGMALVIVYTLGGVKCFSGRLISLFGCRKKSGSRRFDTKGGSAMRAVFSQWFRSRRFFQFFLCLLLVIPSFAVSMAEAKQKRLSDDLFSVTFVNEKQGWVCGRWGSVLHTEDGGATWVPQETGTDYSLSSIYFTDTKNGWAVGDEGTIIRTKDGGKTWSKQKSPVAYFLMGVRFVSPVKGFIVTERTHILSTNDGGNTWKVQFKDEDYILKAIAFSDALNGWAVGEFGYIYHTKDGGDTWEKQAGFSDLSEDTGELVGGTYLFSVTAVDSKTVWAVGIEGFATKSSDGGKTWQQVDLKLPRNPLFSVVSDKTNRLVIAGKGMAVVSTDGGRNWKRANFKPPITYDWIYGIAQRGASGLVAVGREGCIYLNTSDTWQRVTY